MVQHEGKDTVAGRNEPKSRLLVLDDRLTRRLALCTRRESPLGFFRPAALFLEHSYHEHAWMVVLPLGLIVTTATDNQPLQADIVNITIALLTDLVACGLLKGMVRRPRPQHNEHGDMKLFGAAVDQFSFPSGHAAFAMSAALVAYHSAAMPAPARGLIIAYSAAVAVSRVLLGRHYVSDIAAGCVVSAGLWQLQQRHLTPSQDSLNTMFTALQAFYTTLSAPL